MPVGERFRAERPVITLIYLPYDLENPQEGGESFIYSLENMRKFCRYKLKKDEPDHAAFEHDVELLNVLDSVPTFSPLIVELAFERAGIGIPRSYLDLTDDVRAKLKSQLKSRIRPLIVAAYGGQDGTVEKAVEDMTGKLFALKNVAEIMPLVQALRLPPENAVEFLASWIGITYFEYEYSAIQAELKDFSTWIAARPGSAAHIPLMERDHIERHIKFIVDRLKNDWKRIYDLSTEYRDVYNDLIYKSEIINFRNFLLKCKSSYWELGDLLGRFEQTATAWKTFSTTFDPKTTSVGVILDFLSVLRTLHASMAVAEIRDPTAPAVDGGFPNISGDLF